MPNAAIHPTPQELTAFALGKLSETSANTIASHLEKCPACRQAIEKLPADSFIGKVRAARPSDSSLPARPDQPAKMPSLPPKDLPPELASYSKYRFVRELGRGGMGVVYQAEQTMMGRSVAVKVINPSVLAHPDALPRFQGEVQAAAKLDHPNIVRAYDAEQVGNLHLLVMEFVEGSSLADVVAQKGPLPVASACHYIRQAALGLQHAFEQGMVHRDIKPHNLVVNARGQVKVLDFGLARMRSERKTDGGLTAADAFMGTPEYVSPEQATDARSADTRADIYSLGCTLFFLLTGRPPFQGDTAVKLILAQIEKEPPALHEVRADVPVELSALVARMLAKDPAQRFQQPIEVEQALAALLKPGAKGASGVSPPPLGVSSPGRRTAVAADTRQIKAVLREVPGKPLAPEPQAKEAACALASLREPSAAVKTKAKPALAAWWKRPGVMAATVGASLALILMAVIIINVKKRSINSDSGKVMASHDNVDKLLPAKDGFAAVTRDVEPQSGKSAPIEVPLESVKPPVPRSTEVQVPDKPPTDAPVPPDPEPAKPIVADPNALNNESWNVVRSPGKQPQAYRDALAKAEKASELAPTEGTILNTLGVACYRAGEYARAVEILERSLPLNEKKQGSVLPGDSAFLAMAHYQLGQIEQAGKYLERLLFQTNKSRGAIADETLGFVHEAEDLIEPGKWQVRLVIDVDSAKKTYDNALRAARGRVSTAFGTAAKQLAKTKMDAKERQRQLNCLESDLRAFKSKGQLPFSGSMRPAAIAYVRELNSATDRLASTRVSLRRWYRRPQESDEKVDKFLASFQSLLEPQVIGTWSCKGLNFKNSFVWKLYSNGKINERNGASTWSLEPTGMTLRIHAPTAPGGVWIDSCDIGVAGQAFKAKNQRNGQYTGRLMR